MGCYQAKSVNAREKCEAVEFYVSREEKLLLRESWELISNDLASVGLVIFRRLFDIDVDLQKLFKRLMTKTESGQVVLDAVRLEGHAISVMKHIGVVVDNLENNTTLTTALIALGEVHAGYNVKPEMLPLLWPAIRDGVKYALEDKFNNSCELAWKHLYDFVSCHMSEGMIIAQVKLRRESLLASVTPSPVFNPNEKTFASCKESSVEKERSSPQLSKHSADRVLPRKSSKDSSVRL